MSYIATHNNRFTSLFPAPATTSEEQMARSMCAALLREALLSQDDYAETQAYGAELNGTLLPAITPQS